MEINPLSRNDAEQMISFLLKEEAKSEVNLASSFMSAENHEETEMVEEIEKEDWVWFVRALQDIFRGFNLGITFRVHEETERIIARVIDRETKEVIREIPPEKFLDMIARLQELAGVFIDEMV
ncbi:MAG TPA: flagellar protein FlaG [Candidatus Atribacteria bacterium]|nr:flagellar protein FlaG [Candidatus Atribacteria bacterium]HPZ40645.1 flagellar protein FlaG [Candidatus Atribacteria bacterium]